MEVWLIMLAIVGAVVGATFTLMMRDYLIWT